MILNGTSLIDGHATLQARVSSNTGRKTGFSIAILPKTTDLDEIWQGLLLHGIHLWVQFDPDRCMGGSRPNENDFFLSREAMR